MSYKTSFVKYERDCFDYDKFKILPGNRVVDKSHVSGIVKSLKSCGSFHGTILVIKTKAISGKYEYYIGDGQHRMEACRELNYPFNYEVVKVNPDTPESILKYIASLNNSSKVWGLHTYLDAFSSLGYPFYKKLKKIFDDTGLTTNDLVAIYCPEVTDSIARKQFKLGALVPSNEKDSDLLLEAILHCRKSISDRYNTRRDLYPIMRECEDYMEASDVIIQVSEDLTRMGMKFEKDGKEFIRQIVHNLVSFGVKFKPYESNLKHPKKKAETIDYIRQYAAYSKGKTKKAA